MASSWTVVVLALLLHAACLSSPHRLVAGYSSPLSEAASTRREMAKAPGECPTVASASSHRLASHRRIVSSQATLGRSVKQAPPAARWPPPSLLVSSPHSRPRDYSRHCHYHYCRHCCCHCIHPCPPSPVPLPPPPFPLPSPVPLPPPPVNCPDDVVCPMGSYCRLDRNDFPFCTCPFGHALNNGYCNRYYRWRTVGTSVVLYNAPSFANSPATLPPAVLRDPPPNSSACTLVPKGFSGTVGSLRILWNVDDGIRDQLVCGKVLFWDKSSCSGSASVYVIPGKWTTAKFNKLDYATTSVK
ncbi:unnamed protein product [Closterium sp. NIES-54]